jgi:signal transduction histidine kinase
MGYRVQTAEDGHAALEQFERLRPDIVLTDIRMPGMDGLELLHRIKERSRETEVIILTGYGDMEKAVQSLRQEAADFIHKPVSDEVLELALQRAVERIELKRQVREYTENLEQLVEERTRQLVEAERWAAVGQAASGLSHTIKNIAGGLEGSIFVLEKGLDSDKREYLEQGWSMLKEHVSKVKHLSLDLLTLAKPGTIHPEWCRPNEILEAAASFLRDKALEQDVVLRMDLASDMPQARLDAEAVQQCIINLVGNAIEALSEVERSEPQVILRSFVSGERELRIEVEDNGPGMDEATQARLGTPFFSTKGRGGTGLGMMLSQKRIQEHGGSLTCHSAPGQGTRFVLALPLSPPEADAAGPSPA